LNILAFDLGASGGKLFLAKIDLAGTSSSISYSPLHQRFHVENHRSMASLVRQGCSVPPSFLL